MSRSVSFFPSRLVRSYIYHLDVLKHISNSLLFRALHTLHFCSGDTIPPTSQFLCRTSEAFSKSFSCRLLMLEAWWRPVDTLRFVAAVFHSTKRWDFVCAPPFSKFSGRCPTFHLHQRRLLKQRNSMEWPALDFCCSTHSHAKKRTHRSSDVFRFIWYYLIIIDAVWMVRVCQSYLASWFLASFRWIWHDLTNMAPWNAALHHVKLILHKWPRHLAKCMAPKCPNIRTRHRRHGWNCWNIIVDVASSQRQMAR